jgi:hypothetical protein
VDIKYHDDKFRELLLYIAQQMEEDASFGATVLNKILFFSDFLSYRFDGAPITGAVYQKLDHGPAPRRLLPEQERLVSEGRAVIQIRQRGDYRQKRLIALDRPDLTLFSAEEISSVNTVINGLRGHGAFRLSNFSHDISVGWQAAEYGEDIAYATIFLLPPLTPTPSQEKRAKELAVEFAL